MKKWVPGIVVVALVMAVAFLARDRGRLPESPQAAVTALFDAAGQGDDAAYLRLVTGDLRESLLETRRQLGREAFRESLMRSTSGIKGLAVTLGDDAPAGCMAVDLEIVFADRNEHQRILLIEDRGDWAVAAIEEARMVKPPIPYGTPVFAETPAEEETGKP